MIHTALSCFITKGKEPWSIANKTPDSAKTLPAKDFSPISYPKPDNKIVFDLLINLQRSGK
jgi:electron-transferring-flavoprotein dehydrogenase